MQFSIGDIIQHKKHDSFILLVVGMFDECADCIVLDHVQAKYQIWKYDYSLYNKVS